MVRGLQTHWGGGEGSAGIGEFQEGSVGRVRDTQFWSCEVREDREDSGGNGETVEYLVTKGSRVVTRRTWGKHGESPI